MADVLLSVLALGWLGEPVSPGTALGILVLVCGLGVLTLSTGGDHAGWRPVHLLPLGAAFAFGLGNVMRRFSLGTYDVTVLEAVALNETAALVGLR